MNVIDHVEAAGKAPSGNRKAIRAGNHEVSVQASSFHYCEPRMSGLPLNEYSAVEIALWPAGFEEPITPEKPFEFLDSTEINRAMARAKKFLNSHQFSTPYRDD